MTRGGDGHALSPAVVVACHPPLQPLGEEQSIAPAADSLVDARQPGGSEQQQQQQQLQQEQQQEQKLQELRLQQQQTDAALSGWGDECALLKQEQQDNANTEAQEGQRLSVTGRQTSPYPAEKPPPRSSLKHPLPAGVDEATGKAYVEWPTSLLQRVCTHRGSREMSACRVNETMAKVLTQQDLSADRETPYMDDLQEIALLVPAIGIDANGISEDDFSESDQVCDMLLPEGVRIEYAGAAAAPAVAPAASSTCAMRVAAAAAAAAAGDGLTTKQRKVTAKGKKRGPYAKKTTQQGKRKSAHAPRVKETKRAKSLEASTEVHKSKAVPQVPPRSAGRRAPAGTIWLERTQEAEARSAQLALSVKVYETHKEFSAEIEEIARQKAEWQAGIAEVGEIASRRAEWAGGRTDFREKFLEKILQKLEARMLKDADAEI